MSLIKFEIKNEHLLLIKELKWSSIAFPHITKFDSTPNPNTPFTDGEYILDDIALILDGHDKEHEIEHDSEVARRAFSDERIAEIKKIYEELPTALDIICFTGKFELGWYKTKSYLRDWKKYDPKGNEFDK